MASKAVSRTKRPSKTAKSGSSARGAATERKKAPARRPVAKAPAAKTPPARRPRPTAAKARPASPARPKARGSGKAPAPDFAVNKVHQVALQATNLDDAISFYRDILGLRFITRFDPPGYAFFDMGGFRLVLSATASGATLYFRVVDIDEAVKALKRKGVSFLNPPSMIHRDEAGALGKKGMEEWVAFFHDPSGNVLALAERR